MINHFFKKRYLLTILQFISLTVFALLVYSAIGVTTNDPDFAKILRNTNLSNLIVWSYWWPLIIVTAIFFGRFWCSICPMELTTSFFGKIGLRKKPGRILKSGWVITVFYAFILIIGIHTLAIHRIPQYMAIYMLVLFTVATLVGLIWEKRTFCTYVCPIGHLLGLYALLSFRKLSVTDSQTCITCKTKDCVSKENHYKYIGRSCTSELYPSKLKDNKECILCGQCIKACPNDNIAIQKQKIAADLFSDIKLSWAEISFFMIVSAFVVYEILSEWTVSKKILMAIPDVVNGTFHVTASLTGTVKAIILFILLPLTFFSLLALIKRLLAKESWKNAFTQLVLAILPITACMHVLKALLKTTSRIPYWNFVLSDPEGIRSADLIINNRNLLKLDFLTSIVSPTISMLAILLPVIGLVLSFYVIRKQEHTNRSSQFVTVSAVLIYSSLFLISLIIWRIAS